MVFFKRNIVLGAAIIAQKQVMLKYLQRIVGKVKYAEDNIWRLMMFDGIVGCYFPYPAVLYETGTGVSTLGSNVWKRIGMQQRKKCYQHFKKR